MVSASILLLSLVKLGPHLDNGSGIGLILRMESFYTYCTTLSYRGSAFLSMLVKLVCRLAMLAGNCIAWNMAFSQMEELLQTAAL